MCGPRAAPSRVSLRTGSVERVQPTLPYSSYVDPAVLDRERASVFAASWQYVANLNDFDGGVQSIPITAGGLPIILTRAPDNIIRALVNVCSHRGSVICKEPSARESLTCPYHAWRYDLEGTLVNAPRSNRERGFEPSDLHLETLPVGRWGPFIFVGLSQDVMSFNEFLGGLPEEVEAAGIELDELVFHHRAEFTLAANWKIVAENFLECYHCRVAHPGFSKTIDTSPDEYLLATAPTYSTQHGPTREGGVIDTSGAVGRSQFHLLYPNTAINIMPGHANLSIGPIDPVTPDRTDRYLDYFFGSDVPEDWIEAVIDFDDQVGREDLPLVEDMQKGVAVRPQRRGTLFMDSEKLIDQFERYLQERVDYH